MPRAVQTNISQNNVNEDNNNPSDGDTGTAERPIENRATNDSVSSDLSGDKKKLYKISKRFEDEEDPYSLRCFVDGKLKFFKKDTRIWLHKSSNKGKRKQPEDRGRNVDVPPLKIGKLDLEEVSETELDLTENGCENRNEHSNVINSLGSYNLYRSSVSEINSELSSLGESEADLTYSEATTPSSTPSRSEDCRTDVESDSGRSTQTDGTQSVDRLNDFDEAYLNDEVKRNSNSLENLDICNESANNAKSYLDNRNISRKIAPAIDIEDESIRENMLDYAVNLGKSGDTNERQEFVYFTRSIGKARSRKETTVKQSLRPRIKKSNKTRTSRVNTTGYNLRSRRQSTEQSEKQIQKADTRETIKCKGQLRRHQRQDWTCTENNNSQTGEHGTNQALSSKQETNQIFDTKMATCQALYTNQGTKEEFSTNYSSQISRTPKQHQDIIQSKSQQFRSSSLTEVKGSRSNNSSGHDNSEVRAGSSQGYTLSGPLPLLYLATLAICTRSHQF